MYKKTLIVSLIILFFFYGCGIFGPSDPEEESRVVSVEVKYYRDSIAYPTGLDMVDLYCEKYVPGENRPEKIYRNMEKIDDKTFKSEIPVYTEKTNFIWAVDAKRYDGFNKASYMYVCVEIYINGVLLKRTKSMGTDYWCGKAKFVVRNTGTVETFGES